MEQKLGSSAHFGSKTRLVPNKKPRFRVVSKWGTRAGPARRPPPLTSEPKRASSPIKNHAFAWFLNGGRDRDRTDDLLVANEALSQLSYTPEKSVFYVWGFLLTYLL